MSKDENKSPKLWPEGQSKEKHEVGTVNKFSILYNIFTNLIIKDLAVLWKKFIPSHDVPYLKMKVNNLMQN